MFKGIVFLYKFCWKYNKSFILFNRIAGLVNTFYKKVTKAFTKNAFVKTLIILVEQSILYFYLITETLKH